MTYEQDQIKQLTRERDHYKELYYNRLQDEVEKDKEVLKLRKEALALARSLAKLDGYSMEPEEWTA